MYGLKGMAAYHEHAMRLGFADEAIHAFMQSALARITTQTMGADELVALVLEAGQHGVQVMALLDRANTTRYGHPELTKVNIGVGKNPGILISGHDLHDLEELLRQTEGTGVDVYTHSEMLPGHYYPAFKKYKHFVGNYGNAGGSSAKNLRHSTARSYLLPTVSCRHWKMRLIRNGCLRPIRRGIPDASILPRMPTATRIFQRSSHWPNNASRL
mgnify:CR=1 FL=1